MPTYLRAMPLADAAAKRLSIWASISSRRARNSSRGTSLSGSGTSDSTEMSEISVS